MQKLSKLEFLKELYFNAKMKIGRKVYTYVGKTDDYVQCTEIKGKMWSVYIFIFKDEKGNYKVFNQETKAQVIHE